MGAHSAGGGSRAPQREERPVPEGRAGLTRRTVQKETSRAGAQARGGQGSACPPGAAEGPRAVEVLCFHGAVSASR